MKRVRGGALALLTLAPLAAMAAQVDGRQLGGWWGVPFAGVLLSIALLPMLAPTLWHHHYGKITAAWALAFFIPFGLLFGWASAGQGLVHALVAEYIPFVILLTALFTVAGGIYIKGNLRGTPVLNAGILAVGAVLASFMGTTGASMLLIRPLIRANDNRKHVAHVVIFFIFIVSNAGGSLTPLGDPPLFLGFLKGVTFFWTVDHVYQETLFLVGALLVLFFLLDSWYFRQQGEASRADPTPDSPREALGFDGKINFVLLLAIVGLVLMSGVWQPGVQWDVAGTVVELPGVVRDVGMIAVTLISIMVTPHAVHEANEFSWGPMQEVAKLFAGIFLTIIPVIAMLRAGLDGAFAPVVAAVTGAGGEPIPAMYFWASGLLSSVLDNAPTYLVFFNTAGGDAATLMTTHATTLAAVSIGSVFMGAITYIGNAPNLMVKAIAEDRGVTMPSFFGYMVWSCGILLPLFAIITWVWL
ncbi:MAG: sodium:proton antiporter [Comamonadaceae bacterium]|nr:sodium:proton antiporter [Burkholderiales bacterium]MEB2347349.1 sodium:proton antiporter [Comamonadaceae bacterium]